MKIYALGGIFYLLICSNGGRFPLVLVWWFICVVLLTFYAVGRLFGGAQNRLTRIPVNDTCFRLLISQDLFIHIQLPTV